MVHSHLLFAILTRAEPFASKWFSKQPSPPAKLVLELNLVAARKCEVWPLETTTFDLFSCAWGRPQVYLMFWYHTTVVDNIRHAQTMPRATVPVPEELRAKNCESCVSWLSIHLRTGKFKATMGTNILSLGPCILFHFFRCFTPPWHQTGVNSADMIGITEIVQLTSLLYMTCLWPKFVTQCAFTTCQATIPATRHCCRWLALVLLFIFLCTLSLPAPPQTACKHFFEIPCPGVTISQSVYGTNAWNHMYTWHVFRSLPVCVPCLISVSTLKHVTIFLAVCASTIFFFSM